MQQFRQNIIKRFFSTMYKNSATNIKDLSIEDIKTWTSSFDTVLTDCDGVLWLFNDHIPGSSEVINRFKEQGKQIFFVTNNSTKTRAEFVEKAVSMNFKVTKDNVISTAYLVAQFLKNHNFSGKVYVIGSSGVTQELDAVGIKHVGTGPDVMNHTMSQMVNEDFKRDSEISAVVVGFDEHFSFPKMFKAATYLNDPNCLFLATNTDERFPLPNYVVPGTGSIVRAVETCAGRPPVVMGKPNPYICDAIVKAFNVVPERTLMIGDRCNTDILLGKNCGFQTLLVESGIHKFDPDVQEYMKSDNEETRRLVPDLYASKLGDLLPFLE